MLGTVEDVSDTLLSAPLPGPGLRFEAVGQPLTAGSRSKCPGEAAGRPSDRSAGGWRETPGVGGGPGPETGHLRPPLGQPPAVLSYIPGEWGPQLGRRTGQFPEE